MTVILPDAPHGVSPARQDASESRDVAAGGALRTQSRARIGTGIVVVALQILMIHLGAVQGLGTRTAMTIAAIALAYVTAVSVTHAALTVRRHATPDQVTFILLLDLAFAYLWTAVSTTPAHYERALFAIVIIVHVANYYFGRRQARRAIVAGGFGYLV